MINFKEELQKYSPILEIDEIESSINSNELQDILDLLNKYSANDSSNGSNNPKRQE